MNFIYKKKIWWLFLNLFLLIEVLSYFSYLLPELKVVFFFLAVFIIALLTFRDLSLGLLLITAELVIGSQGYIFNWDFAGFTLSIRLAAWLIILSVVFAKILFSWDKFVKKIQNFKNIYIAAGLFFAYCLFAFGRGLYFGYNFGQVFFDFNGWLYLLLLIPWLYFSSSRIEYLGNVLTAGITWLSIKTLFFLYLFTHYSNSFTESIYLWTRDFRLGEITFVNENFWRIFLQSQSMILLVFIFLVFLYLYQRKEYKFTIIENKYLYTFLVISTSALLVSYSRSLWLGTAGALFFILIYFIFSRQLNLDFFKKIGKITLLGAAAFLIVILLAKFPWPAIDSGQGPSFSNRLLGSATEAAGSSRLQQLRPLGTAIGENWLLGSGFGRQVTYISNDPRIKQASLKQSGTYTTSAFEWGYLDKILKLGAVGLALYLFFIYLIWKKAWQENSLSKSLAVAFISIIILNITTPYLNHPLGIGIFGWLLALINLNYENS